MKTSKTSKWYWVILMGGLVIWILGYASCSKQPPQTREQISPSAKSDYGMTATTNEALTWIALDPTKRAKGRAESSGSMLRVFDSTSVILLEKVAPTDKLNIGDICGYTNTDLTKDEISHRLIRIDPSGMLVFKGDNNDAEDPPVTRNKVVWRVVGILYTNGQP